jgi:protein involved in polysaccharide export with SLBB domain
MKFRTLLIIAVASCVASTTAVAQTPDRLPTQDRSKEKSYVPDQLKKETDAKAFAIPMEGPIDPDAYIVGPSDVLQISVWGPISISFPTAVTPEGTLIIPTVGDLSVSGKTLTVVKGLIRDAAKRKFPLGDIGISLLTPRSFLVTLSGSVLSPGLYTVYAIDRVDKVFVLGTAIKPPTTSLSLPALTEQSQHNRTTFALPQLEIGVQIYSAASTRNILLRRKNKSTLRVDLDKYRATGDERYNPTLLDGDAIIVPQRNIENNFLSIYGAVNAPGAYEYAEGDKLSDLVLIASGTASAADLDHVRISRLSADGADETGIDVNLRDILAGRAPDAELRRGDRITVPMLTDDRKNFTVVVIGEVMSPGVQPITKNTTHLSDIIRRAGGLSKHALLSGSRVFRKSTPAEKLDDQYSMFIQNLRSARFNPVDSTFFLGRIRLGFEPVNLDFVTLLDGKDAAQDLVLQDGDLIHIASDQHTVLVQGQVTIPGYQPFISGASLEQYILRAGGYSSDAELGEVRVIKRGTLEWMDPDDTRIESGDQIWVPRYVPKDLTYYLAAVRDVATFVTAVATVGLLILQMRTVK